MGKTYSPPLTSSRRYGTTSEVATRMGPGLIGRALVLLQLIPTLLFAQSAPSIDPGILHVAFEFAEHFPNEVAMCLHGNDRAITDWHLPATAVSTRTLMSVESCPDGTLAMLHTHPWSLRTRNRFRGQYMVMAGESFPGTAEALCYLSRNDVIWLSDHAPESVRYAIVTVRDGVWCWWTMGQVRSLADSPPTLVRPPREQLIVRR